ncbi:MAG: YozE family protein [Dethiobacteraceae bacterium]
MATSCSFTGWLKRQHKRNDPISALARDVLRDPNWPRGRTLKPFLEYLTREGACEGARAALEKSWREYKTLARRLEVQS